MRRLPFLVSSVLCLAAATLVPPAHADGGDERVRAPRRRSRSIGFPWDGSLRGAARLRESEHVRLLPEYEARGSVHGTWQLVQLVQRAAERVSSRLPGARLSVGEMSGPNGGHLDGHRSHQSGRDVDLSFYMVDGRGRPYDAFAFAAFGADGMGLGPNRGLRFDDARNWELVGKLVADGDARVQHIFIAHSLKRRLLAEGRRRGAPRVLLDRAARVMSQPGHHPHRNHMHVRVYCNPRERPRCRDRAPYHPWYPGQPPE